MNSDTRYLLTDETERKAFLLWGGDLNDPEHIAKWNALSCGARGQWRRYVRNNIKPRNKGRGQGPKPKPKPMHPKKGNPVTVHCANCEGVIHTWTCAKTRKWCKECEIEILRRRSRNWHRKNTQKTPNPKYRGRPMIKSTRLTEETKYLIDTGWDLNATRF